MKLITIVANHNHNGLIVISNMEEFATHFCYTTKQKSSPVNK